MDDEERAVIEAQRRHEHLILEAEHRRQEELLRAIDHEDAGGRSRLVDAYVRCVPPTEDFRLASVIRVLRDLDATLHEIRDAILAITEDSDALRKGPPTRAVPVAIVGGPVARSIIPPR